TEWMEKGIGCRMLPVDYAFHSPQMQPYREALVHALGTVAAREPKIPFISTVRGAVLPPGEFLDVNYWGQNIRQPVLFADAVKAAAKMGARTFLEIGPHPVLLSSVEECFEGDEKSRGMVPSLRRGKDDSVTILSSLAKMYVSGASIAWSGVYAKP